MTSTFYTCNVTVAGPGKMFDDVLILIQQTLQAAGYVVEVENEYPYKLGTEDAILAQNKQYFKQYPIKLIAQHCPWGG